MIRRIFPHPLLTLALYAMWVLLTGFSVGHMILGLLIATLVSRTAITLKLDPPRIQFGWPLLRLVWHVVVDVVQSNLAVAKLILRRAPNRRTGFVNVPLDLRDPYGIGALAIIITATPGTLWLDHDAERGRLLLHVLDLRNEAELITLIKTRYERPLLDIFG